MKQVTLDKKEYTAICHQATKKSAEQGAAHMALFLLGLTNVPPEATPPPPAPVPTKKKKTEEASKKEGGSDKGETSKAADNKDKHVGKDSNKPNKAPKVSHPCSASAKNKLQEYAQKKKISLPSYTTEKLTKNIPTGATAAVQVGEDGKTKEIPKFGYISTVLIEEK